MAVRRMSGRPDRGAIASLMRPEGNTHPAGGPGAMTIFVLVHGAWGGAHGFRKVRGPLREAGHQVFTPSLTGIGERAHLTSPQVSLTTHVTDVVNTVLYEDLDAVVLLGYSYG